MKLHEIVSPLRRKRARRVGRGMAAGGGKTAGRGTKGQKSRGGYDIPRRFEGGQTSLVQRLPKAGGFRSRSTKLPTVNIEIVNAHFKGGERLSPKTLFEKGLTQSLFSNVKLVGPGKLKHFVRLENITLTKRLASDLPAAPQSRAAKRNIRPDKTRRSKRTSARKQGK